MKTYVITAIRVLFLALSIVLIAKGRMQIWLIIFAVSLIAALFFGRVFCGYICPMNTIMRPVSWLSKKMKWQTQNKPKFLGSGWLAFVLLLVSLPTMLMAKRFLQRDIPVLVIFFILSVLVTLRYKPAVFHNLICPFGVLQKITGRFALYSERVDADKCTGCHKCERVCPADAVKVDPGSKLAVINPSLCHQCQDCAIACPFAAISYKESASR